MIVYTGLQTKLMQNLGSYKLKRSRMQRRTFKVLAVNSIAMVIFVLVAALFNWFKTKSIYDSHWYIFENDELGAT